MLKSKLGSQPSNLYPDIDGISIVYSTSDYAALEIETKVESLKKEIITLAEKYIFDKYNEDIIITSYIRFLHPEMSGYNGYHLWL